MRIFYFGSVGSTSDEAGRLLDSGIRPLFGVVAIEQSHGRGCHGSNWDSRCHGNIYFSVALPTEIFSLDSVQLFPQVFALNFAIGLGSVVHLSVKWPNDIFLAGEKVGGILLETALSDGILRRAICGVGLNVDAGPELIDSPYGATFFKAHSKGISYALVLDAVIHSVENAISAYECGGYEELIAREWRNFDMLYGKLVRIRSGEGIYVGQAGGVDASGRLILRLSGGGAMFFNSANSKIVW
jgi:BirA family biotin operon repressor/biotin-[acetyl-CoA-carboxylase] ligase